MNELPVIENCNDCGACCATQVTPPGYAVFAAEPKIRAKVWGDAEDLRRLEELPVDARWLLMKRLAEVLTGNSEDRPCCWLDLETKRCRFYEYRPSICRDFEVGGESCRSWRDENP